MHYSASLDFLCKDFYGIIKKLRSWPNGSLSKVSTAMMAMQTDPSEESVRAAKKAVKAAESEAQAAAKCFEVIMTVLSSADAKFRLAHCVDDPTEGIDPTVAHLDPCLPQINSELLALHAALEKLYVLLRHIGTCAEKAKQAAVSAASNFWQAGVSVFLQCYPITSEIVSFICNTARRMALLVAWATTYLSKKATSTSPATTTGRG